MSNYEAELKQAHSRICHEGKRDKFVPVIGENIVTGETIEFECIMDTKNAGFHPPLVMRCLAGKRKSTGGYYWRRKQ